MINNLPKIFIAGHNGMVGSAIFRVLKKFDVKIIVKNRSELDLLNQKEVEYFFKNHDIDQVYLAAARVGGIHANNTYPADFIYENLMIQNNIIHNAYSNGIKKLLFLGSSCIYPKITPQPITEDALLTGKLEQTNEPYAIAKIAGIKMCESYNRQFGKSHGIDFRSIMPTNLYGPGDNYHPENSHVIPALIKRFHQSKVQNISEVKIWGTGTPKRDFLYVEDLARASVYLMNLDKSKYYNNISLNCSHINVGSGNDISIRELAQIIKKIVGFNGKINFDPTRPDGTPKKLLSIDKIQKKGFKTEVDLYTGLKIAYQDYLKRYENT